MAKYTFDQYKQALDAGVFTPEARAELLKEFPALKYEKGAIKAALADNAYDDETRSMLLESFPEFQPGGITDALKAAPELAYQGSKEGILGAMAALGENMPYKMEDVGVTVPDELKPEFQRAQEQTPMTAENIRSVKMPETQKRIQDIYEEKNIQPGTVGGVAADVFTSLGQMAPIVGLTMVAPEASPAGLFFLSTISGGQKYGEARKAGYSEKEALLQGLGYGAAEYLGEKIGLDALMDGFKNVAKRPALINITREILKNAGVEAGEEGATQILQNAIDIAGKKYNPQAKNEAPGLFEGVPYAAMTGAFAGGIMGGATSGVGELVNRQNPGDKAETTQPKADAWEDITNQLSEDEFKKIFEQANAENPVPQSQQAPEDSLTGQGTAPPTVTVPDPIQQIQQTTDQLEQATAEQKNIAGAAIETIMGNAPERAQGAVEGSPDITNGSLPDTPVKTPEIQFEENQNMRSAEVPIDKINQAAELQFKRNVDKNFVTDKLKGRKYNPLLAGTIDVFVNPEDGKTYVWNGNHRLVTAKQNNVPTVKVAYTDFANVEEAKAAAILKNLAENNGEPLDYRNFFRAAGEQDFNTLKDAMAEKGIDIGKGMAVKGYALSKLNDYLTSEYERGNLPENVAVEIGKNQLSDADQTALYKHIQSKYLDNKTVPNNGQIKNLIEFARSVPKAEGEADLFGDTEIINQMSVKSEIADYVGNTIKRDKNILKKLSSEDLASAAMEKEIGNIKTDQAATEAQKAAMAEMYFKKRMFAAGDEISQVLNVATQRVIDGEPINKVKADTFLKTRRILESEEKNGSKNPAPKPAVVSQGNASREQQPAERNAATEGVAEASKIKISDVKSIEELAHNQKRLADAKVTSIEGDKATVNFKGREYLATETPTGLKFDELAAPKAPVKQEGLFEEDLTAEEKDQKAAQATEDLFSPRKSSGVKAFYNPRAAGMAEYENARPVKPEPTPYQHAVAGKLNELNRVEIVKLFEEIVNSIPEVKKRLRKEALGLFRPGTGQIELDASRLKTEDYQTITQVIAHEIGHAIDWKEGEVNRTLARGNVLGHLGALARFMKKTLNLTPSGTPRYLTTEQRKKIYNETRKRLANSAAWAENDYSNSFFSEVYREEVSKYLDDNNLIEEEVVRGEMASLAQKFLGWSDESVKAAWDWFSDPAELYANTFGAFLTNPGMLFKEAPTAANMLYDYLENKPATLKLYQFIQQKINSGDRYKENLNYIKEKMMSADARQSEHLAKTTDKQSLKEDILTNFVDRLTPLLKYATVANRDESSFKMLSAAQKLRSINDIVEAYLKGFLPEINNIIKDNNIDITDLGLKAYFTRVIEERSKGGIIDLTDAKLADKLNEELNKNYTGEQIAAMEKIFDKLREARRPLIEGLVKQGLYPPELAKKLLDNKYYFTFDITEHLDKTLGAGNSISQRIHKQIGTLKVSANPFVSTILKDIALKRLSVEMAFTQQAIEFLNEKGVTVKPAAKDRLGRLLNPGTKSGMGLVEMLREGKAVGYYIPADIAKAINENTFEVGAGLQALTAINNMSRGAFTSGNPPFALISNPIRDVQDSFLKTPYGVKNFATWSKEMAKSFYEAVTNTQDENQIREAVDRGMLYGDRAMNYQPDADLSTWENILRKYKIANYEDFDAAKAPKYLKALNSIMAAAEFMVSPILNMGARIEKAPKLATLNFLNTIKSKYDLSEAEIDFIVTDLSGTPNGKRKGRLSPYTNNIFLFSNIWAQGMKSYVDAYKYGKFEFLAKAAGLAIAPVLLTWLYSRADDDDKWWSKISDYYKANFSIIPVWWLGGPRFDSNGKPVFLTLPRPELQRALGATVWKALEAIKDGKIRDGITQIFDTWAGDVPKFSPIFTALGSAMIYASGRNPYDFFRGRNVINEDTFNAKDFGTDKAFVTYICNLFGLSTFYKIDTSERPAPNQKPSTLESISKTPWYGLNMAGRLLKVDDRGQQQQIAEIKGEEKTKDAREKKLVISYIEKVENKRLDEITDEERAAKNKHLKFFKAERERIRNPKKAQIKAAPKDIRPQIKEVLK